MRRAVERDAARRAGGDRAISSAPSTSGWRRSSSSPARKAGPRATRRRAPCISNSFPTIPASWRDDALAAKWETIRRVRSVVTGAIEIARADKRIGSSLEAQPARLRRRPGAARRARRRRFRRSLHHLRHRRSSSRDTAAGRTPFDLPDVPGVAVVVERAPGVKCARSWRYFDPATADPGLPRRDAARRGGAARAEGARGGLDDAARAIGGGVAIVVLVALDQASKVAGPRAISARPRRRRWRLTPFLDLDAALEPRHFLQPVRAGLGSRDSWLLLGADGVATALLASGYGARASRLVGLGLGAIIGGALGNGYDRLAYGAVVDFLDLHAFGRHFFVFNARRRRDQSRRRPADFRRAAWSKASVPSTSR